MLIHFPTNPITNRQLFSLRVRNASFVTTPSKNNFNRGRERDRVSIALIFNSCFFIVAYIIIFEYSSCHQKIASSLLSVLVFHHAMRERKGGNVTCKEYNETKTLEVPAHFKYVSICVQWILGGFPIFLLISLSVPLMKKKRMENNINDSANGILSLMRQSIVARFVNNLQSILLSHKNTLLYSLFYA